MYKNNVIFKKNKLFSTKQSYIQNKTNNKINQDKLYDSGSFDKILQEEINFRNSKK